MNEITYNTTECQKNAKTNSEIVLRQFCLSHHEHKHKCYIQWVPQKNMQLYKLFFMTKIIF